MAQRTGAERFLAPLARSAGAGVLLALALSALALAGCGGGSSDPPSESTTSASPSSAAAAPGAGEGQGGGGDAGEKTAQAKGQGGSPQAEGAPASPQGKKQGPRIAPPKGPEEQGPSAAEIANATVADIALQSPAIVSEGGEPGSIPPTYTCDGKDSWPAFAWSGVPAGTAELALYAMNVQPVEGKLFVDWALAGIDPALGEIKAGELPKGAITATNSFGKRGYSLCPEGRGEIYMFALYALPKRLGLRPGFDARAARAQILAVSGNVGLLPALYAH